MASLVDLFTDFSKMQQERMRASDPGRVHAADAALDRLLKHPHLRADAFLLRRSLTDSYAPLGMLIRTIFADVTGMRFHISKRRPELEPALARELIQWAEAFDAIRTDIPAYFDPRTVTCIPLDEARHPLDEAEGQWCSLCGLCCRIGGVPATPPPGIRYPQGWDRMLRGESSENQQMCPFLFQYFGAPIFICAIHNIKPVACRSFDREDCLERLSGSDLHG